MKTSTVVACFAFFWIAGGVAAPDIHGQDSTEQLLKKAKVRRKVILNLLKEYEVSAVFAGHWHRNSLGRDGKLQMITTGPVGKPLGKDGSGFRIVKVFPDRVEHQYYPFGSLPSKVELKRVVNGN